MSEPIRNTHYRTSDGLEDYVFDFEAHDGGWRIYIVRQPPYDGRNENLHSTHRLLDRDRHYVCWDSELRTLDDAKAVAALWADATQNYRRRGRFEAPPDRSHVYDRSASSSINPAATGGAPEPPSEPAQRPWYWRLLNESRQ